MATSIDNNAADGNLGKQKHCYLTALVITCRVYNINYGKNRKLLEQCPFLRDYMTFVDYVRGYIREYGYDHLEHCIEVAIDRCLEENILREFLIRRRTEVVKIMELDYTFDKRILLERKESREEGWEEGRIEGHKVGREQGRQEGRKEGRKEGRIEGREQGRQEGHKVGLKEGFTRGQILTYYEMNLTPKEIAGKLCLPEEKVEEVIRSENTEKNN